DLPQEARRRRRIPQRDLEEGEDALGIPDDPHRVELERVPARLPRADGDAAHPCCDEGSDSQKGSREEHGMSHSRRPCLTDHGAEVLRRKIARTVAIVSAWSAVLSVR